MAAAARDAIPAAERLRITEMFHSLQGEADTVGLPTVFVRLTGCPLRCRYCDTEYAFYGGEWWSIAALVERVTSFDTPYVCVTGGEPLAQPNVATLMRRLCDAGPAGVARDERRAGLRAPSTRASSGCSTSRRRARARSRRNCLPNLARCGPRTT